jgi:hypothetical protein
MSDWIWTPVIWAGVIVAALALTLAVSRWPRRLAPPWRALTHWLLALLDQWAPVLRTRTGAYATLGQALGAFGLTASALGINLDAISVGLMLSFLAYTWLRTLHGRRHARGPISPEPRPEWGPRPFDPTRAPPPHLAAEFDLVSFLRSGELAESLAGGQTRGPLVETPAATARPYVRDATAEERALIEEARAARKTPRKTMARIVAKADKVSARAARRTGRGR